MTPTVSRSSIYVSAISKSASSIQAFLSDFGVCNVWRTLQPNNRKYSFFLHIYQTCIRIEYIFTDNQFISLVHPCTYQSIVISDQVLVILFVALPGLTQRSRQWQFNPTLLSNDNFVKFMETEIAFFFPRIHPLTSPNLLYGGCL